MTLTIASLMNLQQTTPPVDHPKLPESPLFWMPRASSTVAGQIDWLFDVMVWISAICALGILGAMIIFCMKYRAASREANEVRRAERPITTPRSKSPGA